MYKSNKERNIALKNRAISIYKLPRTEYIKNWPISRTGYKKLAHFQNGVSILGENFFKTGCQFGVLGGTYTPKKYSSAPPGRKSYPV